MKYTISTDDQGKLYIEHFLGDEADFQKLKEMLKERNKSPRPRIPRLFEIQRNNEKKKK